MGFLPSSRNGAPAGLIRRPQKSELMRSESCQSGPCSRRTTFLPALARTAAKTDPDAPAPTMTTSTFSLAMSPPLGRRDVGHVGDAEAGIAFHGAVDDVDGVAAQHEIDERSARPLPAFDLVLAHAVDEAALLGFAQLCKLPAVVERLAGAIDRAQRRAIEIRVGRAHVEDARLEQRLLRRNRDLLIDEVRYPGLARPRDERLAEGIERCRLRGGQRAQWDALRPRSARRKQNLGTAHREGERADGRAFHEGASFDVVHGLLPGTRSGCTPRRQPSPGGPSREDTGDGRRLLEWLQNSTPISGANQAVSRGGSARLRPCRRTTARHCRGRCAWPGPREAAQASRDRFA